MQNYNEFEWDEARGPKVLKGAVFLLLILFYSIIFLIACSCSPAHSHAVKTSHKHKFQQRYK